MFSPHAQFPVLVLQASRVVLAVGAQQAWWLQSLGGLPCYWSSSLHWFTFGGKNHNLRTKVMPYFSEFCDGTFLMYVCMVYNIIPLQKGDHENATFIKCQLASLTSFPALKHEHCNCEDRKSLIFFLTWTASMVERGRRPKLCMGIPRDFEQQKDQRQLATRI